MLSMEAPPLLWTACLPKNCATKYRSKQTKFTGDTMVIGLAHNNDETMYRTEISMRWCRQQLHLECHQDQRAQCRLGETDAYSPVHVKGSPEEFTRNHHPKNATICCFLGDKGFGLNIATLVFFYHCPEHETDRCASTT